MDDLTQLIRRSSGGDEAARDRVVEAVYEELHRLARSQMRGQSSGHTLQPTALVNEAFLRLFGGAGVDWNDRSHFLAVAATAMRQILVNHARDRRALKRGGGWQRVTISGLAQEDRELDLIALDEALEQLRELSPRQARIVELRFFASLTLEETAQTLDVGLTTVKDEWHLARTWLAVRLKDSPKA